MWIAPVLAIAAAAYLARSTPAALAAAGPILFLWLASPAIVWWISRPLVRREARLTAGQNIFLQKISRKTWAFFETFVGPEDHWLPPDNYQEHPVAVVAHRTSPTNMGLSLLANLTAYDFGYIPAGQLIERTANALHTMAALERHQGHFYNWYDTQSLQPLPPLYVSSVDSGNLAGHLLTLRPGLLALADHKMLGPRLFEGLSDTLRILLDAAGEAAGAAARPTAERPGNRLRFAAGDARGGAASGWPGWRRLPRRWPPARTGPRCRAGERHAVVGAGARPPVPRRPRRADVARSVARSAGRARRTRRLTRQR